MTTVRLELPPKLVPVFEGEADFRGAWGGRGSAKTRTFAKMAAVNGLRYAAAGDDGVIVCGREFMNSLSDSSLAEVKAAIASEPWLAEQYDVGETYVRTKDRAIDFVFVGLRHNLESIKSKSRIRLLWVDEAEPVSDTAWTTAIPTVREEGSEVWATWNPKRKKSATHKRFRENPPARSKFVEMNWRDNPWFTAKLERNRQDDLKNRPDQYEHIWEGDFVSVVEGAYYAQSLAEAKAQGRIGFFAKDPLMTVRAIWDIGGTGAKADACSIWIAQFIGGEIRVLDYYEAKGQPLATHVQWLRDKGWGKALCILPHDGSTNDKVYDVSYESALQEAGFETEVIPNQGKGAAKMRIEAGRRLFPRIRFNADTTEPGREALGWYHEQLDEKLNIGLGPHHDWSSHGADAFGLMCVVYEQPTIRQPESRYGRKRTGGGSW
nr:PBSX family phage terminase large subunit [Afipia sp.]